MDVSRLQRRYDADNSFENLERLYLTRRREEGRTKNRRAEILKKIALLLIEFADGNKYHETFYKIIVDKNYEEFSYPNIYNIQLEVGKEDNIIIKYTDVYEGLFDIDEELSLPIEVFLQHLKNNYSGNLEQILKDV